MSDSADTGDPISSSDIQNYLQSFNKEIGEASADPDASSQLAAAIASDDGTGSTSAVISADTIYAIDAEKLAAATGGNIVLATTDQVSTNQVAGEEGEYPAFMVMNDQQYMLIVSNDTNEQPNTAEEATLVMTTDANGATVAAEVPDEQPQPEMETPKTRGTRSMFRKQRIKEEVFDEDGQTDISIYDFNDLPHHGRHPSASATIHETRSTAATKVHHHSMDEDDDEDDQDFKTPRMTKHRGRPRESTTTRRSMKSASGSASSSSMLNSSIGSNSSVHVCTYCSYTSTKRYLLSRHLKSHSEDRPHKCGICERGFKTLASLQNHVNTHTGVRPHQCKFCDAAFTTSGELVRHIRYRHTHEKPHRCTECDYASVELSKLKRHMRCHTGERPYQCPHCTYASPDTYKLKRHLRIHTGEKPYVCDVCQQRFTQSNSLKAHKLIHTGNKPIFKCEFCPTTCGRKTDLRIHVQKLHTSDKMLTCKRCDQSFPDRYQFKLHLKTHEGEKCFKCDLCNYASVSARHLESHMLIHTDQKPFICDQCQLSFRQKQLLKRHKNLYHNPSYIPPVPKEKTHECFLCSKAFRHKGNLIRHMSLHDPDAKNNSNKDHGLKDDSRLIDDEIYEGEEDDLDEDDDTAGGSSMSIVDPTILDTTTASVTDGSISFTIDQQTQQLINQSGNDRLMLVVMNSDSGEATVAANANGQPTLVAVTPASATPRIISRRVTKNSSKTHEVPIFDTDDKSLMNITNNIASQQAPQLSFDTNDSINLEEQLQKRKDLEDCFGFKDDDEEDEIILSMPSVNGQ